MRMYVASLKTGKNEGVQTNPDDAMPTHISYLAAVAITGVVLTVTMPPAQLVTVTVGMTVVAIAVAIVAVSVSVAIAFATRFSVTGAADHQQLVARQAPTAFDSCCDTVVAELEPSQILLWFVRHGESTANVENARARKLDEERGDGKNTLQVEHEQDWAFTDPPLTADGVAQAMAKRAKLREWRERPMLVVCSPLTRAIQTAALVFQDDLAAGVPLVIRPELREFFPALVQDAGRPLTELRDDPNILRLPNVASVLDALSDEKTQSWREAWDASLARGSHWREHCNDGSRVDAFKAWVLSLATPSTGLPKTIATVSHYATIHAFVNREPCIEAAGWQRKPAEELAYKLPEQWRAFLPPEGGVRLPMPNVGHLALVYDVE